MVKNLLAVVAGVIVGGLMVAVMEIIGHSLFPPPPGLDASNPASLAKLMEQVPMGAKLSVVVAWAVGSLAAGFVAGKLASFNGSTMALIAGGVLLCAGGYTMIAIPHPVWMVIAGLLVPLPSAYAGWRLTAKSRTERREQL
jgi:hypothetical protein